MLVVPTNNYMVIHLAETGEKKDKRRAIVSAS